MSSSSDRFFSNPYQDFSAQLNLTADQIVRTEHLYQYAKETAFLCMNRLKPKPKYCDGALYTGNLGLIFMCFKLLGYERFRKYEQEIKNYMRECLAANEEYYEMTGQKETREVAFILGKGGLSVMGCFVSRILGDENKVGKYARDYASLASICEPINFLKRGSDEMFVGRAGYLWYSKYF